LIQQLVAVALSDDILFRLNDELVALIGLFALAQLFFSDVIYNAGTSGVTYTRWGRRTCEENGATLLYNGKSLLSVAQYS